MRLKDAALFALIGTILLTILLAATMCVVSRILFDSKDKPALVKKLNFTGFTLAVLTFVAANIILIGLADE